MPPEASVLADRLAEMRRVAARIGERQREFERARDPRAVFAFVYHNITLDLAEHLQDPKSTFARPEWVAELAIAFAGRYLEAMDWVSAARKGRTTGLPGPPPRAWLDVDAAIHGTRSYVLEDLLFSMAAHISCDLPHALLATGLYAEHLPDYHRVNDVLASNTDAIEEAVAERYQPTLVWLDALAGRFDEFFTNYGIRTARGMAWYNATRLAGPGRGEAADSIARSAAGFISAVRHPGAWWLRGPLAIARAVIPPRRRWPPPEAPIRREIVSPGAIRARRASAKGKPRRGGPASPSQAKARGGTRARPA